jgi:hypothetical protein
MSRSMLATKLVKVVAPPVGLVGAVLGSIIAGIAAPSEAASMGALASCWSRFTYPCPLSPRPHRARPRKNAFGRSFCLTCFPRTRRTAM